MKARVYIQSFFNGSYDVIAGLVGETAAVRCQSYDQMSGWLGACFEKLYGLLDAGVDRNPLDRAIQDESRITSSLKRIHHGQDTVAI